MAGGKTVIFVQNRVNFGEKVNSSILGQTNTHPPKTDLPKSHSLGYFAQSLGPRGIIWAVLTPEIFDDKKNPTWEKVPKKAHCSPSKRFWPPHIFFWWGAESLGHKFTENRQKKNLNSRVRPLVCALRHLVVRHAESLARINSLLEVGPSGGSMLWGWPYLRCIILGEGLTIRYLFSGFSFRIRLSRDADKWN